MLRKVVEKKIEGISVGERKINCIQFADDIAILGKGRGTFQRMLRVL